MTNARNHLSRLQSPASAVDVLNRICHVRQGTNGQDYLRELSLSLVRELGLRYALIGQPDPERPHAIRTRIVVVDGEVQDNFSYDLAGTPCELVLGGQRVCLHANKVAELFPQDVMLAQMQVASYVGAPIIANNHRLRGLIVLLDIKPLEQPDLIRPIMEFIATRVAVELEREADEARREYDQQQTRQREKMEAIGQLSAGVAHDFNNMLGAIRSGIELLQHRLSTNTDAQSHLPVLGIMLNATRRAADLTAQLLAFGRRQPKGESALSLHTVVNRAIELIRRTFGPRIVIHLDLCPDDPVLIGNESALEHALVNLCINARDAMPDGGILSLSTEVYRDVTSGCGQVILRIVDNGAGMSEAVRRRIFEPFFSTKGIGQGTGLGLAAVYGTVATHNGTIDVSSAPGRGSTFTISLPLTSQTPIQPVAIKSTSFISLVPRIRRILLVDDEDFLRSLIGEQLRAAGATAVVEASNVAQALALVEHEEPFDATVLDLLMPGLPSSALVDVLRQKKNNPRILLMSGFSADCLVGAMKNEAFLEKPFEFHHLVNCLNQLDVC